MRTSAARFGRALVFGRSTEGQLGARAVDHLKQPVEPFAAAGSVSAISAGARNSAAVVGGRLYAFGTGDRGELGLGQALITTPNPTMLTISGSSENSEDVSVVRAILGPSTSAYLSSEGAVYMSGEGREGALGLGGQIGPVGSYHGGQQPEAVHEPRLVTSLTEAGVRIKDVALSRHFSLLLSDTGEVYACGSGFHGELGLWMSAYATAPSRVVVGLPDPAVDPAVSIAAGSGFSLAATRSGKLFFWGRVGAGGVPGQLSRDRSGAMGKADGLGSAATSSNSPAGATSSDGSGPSVIWHPQPAELALPGFDAAAFVSDGRQLRLSAGAQHAVITDGSRVWMLGYYSGQQRHNAHDVATANASTAGISLTSAPPHIECRLRLIDLEPALGHEPDRVSAISCGPFSTGFVADGHLLMAGRLTALHGWTPQANMRVVQGHRRRRGAAHTKEAPAGSASSRGGSATVAHPDFSESPVLALAPEHYGPVTAVAVGGGHAAVIVDE